MNNFFEHAYISLKDASIDDSDQNNIKYMVSNENIVTSFDKVMKNYCKVYKPSEQPNSNDVLYEDDEGNVYFIEFKNGNIDNTENCKIKMKILESIIVYNDIKEKDLDFCRKNMTYILVYNSDIKHKSNNFTNSLKKNEIQNTPASLKIRQMVAKKAGIEYIEFGLQRYEKIYFKKVHTFCVDQFINCITKYCTSLV